MRILLAATALVASITASTATAATDPTEPAEPQDLCRNPDLDGDGILIDVEDGFHVEAATVGNGPAVAIFFPQSHSLYCGFADFVVWLAEHDVRAILVNSCGTGLSECPPELTSSAGTVVAAGAVVDFAVDEGAERITLVGASLGGTVALTAAADLDTAEDVDAVVDLSGAIRFSDLDSEAAAPDVTAPLLLAGSDADRSPTREDVERVGELAGSEEVELWFAESGHGWDFLAAEDGEEDTEFRLLVRDWITGDRP